MSWWQSLLWGKPAATREIQPARRVLLAKAGSTENLIEHFQAVQKNHRKFRSVDLTVTLSAVVDGWIAMDLICGCPAFLQSRREIGFPIIGSEDATGRSCFQRSSRTFLLEMDFRDRVERVCQPADEGQ